MTTLRTAAQQALEALKLCIPKPRSTDDDYAEQGWKEHNAAITVLRAALAAPQEPVAWGVFEGENLHDFYSLREDAEKMAGYKGSHATVMPLYTAPPQRQPLAEWQINDLMADIDPEDVCSWSFRQGAYAAEKHHGVRP